MDSIFSYFRRSYLFTCCVLATFFFTSLRFPVEGLTELQKYIFKEADFINKMTKMKENIEVAAALNDIGLLIEYANQMRYEVEKHTGKKIKFKEIFLDTILYLQEKGMDLNYNQYVKMKKMIEWNTYCSSNSSKKKDKDEIPLSVQVAVIVTLCGFFLVAVPIAKCRQAGFVLIADGASRIGSEIVGYNKKKEEEQDDDEDDNEKEKDE